jgi:ADP-heptose:LPS heptosyltransferase
MYTDVVRRTRQLTPRHSVMNQWDLLAALGIPHGDPVNDPVRMPGLPDADRRADTLLGEAGVTAAHTLVVVHVSASNRFKRWPEASFAALISGLVSRDARRRVVIISGPSDAESARRVAAAARANLGPLAHGVVELSASGHVSLTELRAVIARAAVYIGGDSGPLHVAATTTVPIVELLGPTLAERSFPWRDPRWFSETIDAGALPCRPCRERVCEPGDFRCLTSISADRVLAAAERALARSSGSTSDALNTRRIRVAQA